MKKFMSILITLSLIGGPSTLVFAAGTDTTTAAQTTTSTQSTSLTPEQKQARDAFLKVHSGDMNQLTTLRQQTKEAEEANKAVAKQIKDKTKSKTTLNGDTVSKLKDLGSQRKALVDQEKQLHQQITSLKSQYKDAASVKDTAKMSSIKQQIQDLNNQVKDIKTKDDAIKTQIAPLKDQVKAARDVSKQLSDNVKSQLQQAETIRQTIKTQENEKTQLWNTYKENIKNKDYTAAETTFKSIIDKKVSILDNIKQIGTIRNQVLNSLN